jgi:hypothetical protein
MVATSVFIVFNSTAYAEGYTWFLWLSIISFCIHGSTSTSTGSVSASPPTPLG